MKEENLVPNEKEELSFVFEINEVYKVDGNNEKFFRNTYKLVNDNYLILKFYR